jgi:hypothetical protein
MLYRYGGVLQNCTVNGQILTTVSPIYIHLRLKGREMFGRNITRADKNQKLCHTLSSFPLILLSWTRKSLSSALKREKNIQPCQKVQELSIWRR